MTCCLHTSLASHVDIRTHFLSSSKSLTLHKQSLKTEKISIIHAHIMKCTLFTTKITHYIICLHNKLSSYTLTKYENFLSSWFLGKIDIPSWLTCQIWSSIKRATFNVSFSDSVVCYFNYSIYLPSEGIAVYWFCCLLF
jgi:hypothetical protein